MKSLLLLIFLFMSAQAVACPNLLGTWQSSKELSMKYSLNNPEFSAKNIEFKNQIYGILKVTYYKSTIHTHGAPTQKITIDGNYRTFHFEDLTFNYKVLSCTKDSITTKEYYSHGEPNIETIHFIDENTFWVSPKHDEKEREYFIRIKNQIPNQ